MTCGSLEFNGTQSNEVKNNDIYDEVWGFGFLDRLKSNQQISHSYIYVCVNNTTTDSQSEIILLYHSIFLPWSPVQEYYAPFPLDISKY